MVGPRHDQSVICSQELVAQCIHGILNPVQINWQGKKRVWHFEVAISQRVTPGPFLKSGAGQCLLYIHTSSTAEHPWGGAAEVWETTTRPLCERGISVHYQPLGNYDAWVISVGETAGSVPESVFVWAGNTMRHRVVCSPANGDACHHRPFAEAHTL